MTAPQDWRKASASVNIGNCVEVASADGVHVRDTADPGPVLAVSADAWAAFLGTLR